MAKTLFLGVEGSGKTTLAMALAKAFARHAAEGWYLRPHDRGAYNFATVAPEDFARDGFPRQTANVREMTWRIERDGEDCGALEILDYPGEVYRLAFLDADDEPDPVAFRERAEAHAQEIAVLRDALADAARVFVLFNLQDALDLRGNDANRSAMWVTNESLKAVKALPSKPQVTLVFTQVDRYQTADDFLHAFTPRDLDLVGHDHPDVDWTMVSVMVPPESEFGVDAFVRRCTGLEAFGVPTGRPGDAAAQNRGASLRDLAASLSSGTTLSSVGRSDLPLPEAPPPGVGRSDLPLPEATLPDVPGAPRPGTSVAGPRRRLSFVLGLAVFAAILLAIVAGEMLHERALRRSRLAEQARQEQAARRAEAEKQAKLAAEEKARAAEAEVACRRREAAEKARAAEAARKAAAEKARAAEAARKAAEEKARAEAEVACRRREAAEKARAAAEEKARAEAARQAELERRRREAAERSHPTAASDALAGRLGGAAWTAWTASAARTAARRKAAEANLEKALASESPQAAHEALCDAAEAGLGAAQEWLARVYDVWGWGGWVRAKEDAGAKWTAWLRRIDFPNGGKAYSVSRPAPNAEEFRRLALDWYRTAAENGVASAAEALRRHGETPPEPETAEAARALARESEEAK